MDPTGQRVQGESLIPYWGGTGGQERGHNTSTEAELEAHLQRHCKQAKCYRFEKLRADTDVVGMICTMQLGRGVLGNRLS